MKLSFTAYVGQRLLDAPQPVLDVANICLEGLALLAEDILKENYYDETPDEIASRVEDMLYIGSDGRRGRWTFGSNYDRGMYIVYYENTDTWHYMRAYGNEYPYASREEAESEALLLFRG